MLGMSLRYLFCEALAKPFPDCAQSLFLLFGATRCECMNFCYRPSDSDLRYKTRMLDVNDNNVCVISLKVNTFD